MKRNETDTTGLQPKLWKGQTHHGVARWACRKFLSIFSGTAARFAVCTGLWHWAG
jgi:hypothetical protein